MARTTGPKCRLARGLGASGVDIEIKSRSRDIADKCRWGSKPGKPKGYRSGKLSNYGEQLNMKQTMKRYYGVHEKQFRRYYHEAEKRKGSTADNLMRILETRLDNVVYRAGYAVTRADARQLVNHGHVVVNGQRVNIPSFSVNLNDVIEVREASRKSPRVLGAVEIAKQYDVSPWLDVDFAKFRCVFSDFPNGEQWPAFFKVNQVIELYSK